MSWRSIMFVVDSSGHADPRVLRKLMHLARSLDAEIEIVHSAFEWTALRKGGIGSLVSDQEVRETIERRHAELADVVEALRAGGVSARSIVTCERPGYESILRQVLISRPDLLAVQSTRHHALARLILSYTDFKIETCPCPLLLMKTERSYRDACVVAAVDPMQAHDKPAVLDEAIVNAAILLANAVGGALHICHAVAPWPNVLEVPDATPSVPEQVYAERCASYREEAELRVKALARGADIREDRMHITWGDAAEIVPLVARSVNADVVVIGAASRSALQRTFVGHTAERVLDALDCDVLVVKPPGFQAFDDRSAVAECSADTTGGQS